MNVGDTRDPRQSLSQFQINVAKRALRDAIELADMVESSNKVGAIGDSEYGRIVEQGVDITASIRRKQREYKKLLREIANEK